jgi:dihydroorotate dehydrogenase electron transfer subunit
MTQGFYLVAGVRQAGENIFVIRFLAPALAASIKAGQFVNIKVAEGCDPLLRRPFSVYRTDDGHVEVIFNIVGKGTAILRRKAAGDFIDVLGPLGVPYSLSDPAFTTGILVGGGLGVAPLPIATAGLKAAGKRVVTFLGGRTAGQVVQDFLDDPLLATDDGSLGFRGTVVDLLGAELSRRQLPLPKIFACGPTPMLRAVAEFARARGIPCEVSLEGPMGCGFGICQGCPVELAGPATQAGTTGSATPTGTAGPATPAGTAGPERKYALMCKDGPVFDIEKIRI